jgi:hypothetical protein
VPTAEPEPAAEPAPAAEAVVTTEPEPTTEPEATTESVAPADEAPVAAEAPSTKPKLGEATPATPATPATSATSAPPEATPAPESQPVTAEATPEPGAAVEPAPEPEPATEAAPEPNPVAEPKPATEVAPAEPTADTAPEPEPTTEKAPEAEPQPATAKAAAPKATPKRKPEATTSKAASKATPKRKPKTTTPKATPKPEPVAAQADEPTAADGAQAPQGPPAADNASRTGGAGGKTNPAEGEAEADRPAATPEGLVPALATAYKAAGATLEKHNLTGTRARVYLVLDRSASMRPYYKDGSAQAIGEQSLALAAHLDPKSPKATETPEATVHVVFFSTELDGTGELTLTDHENKIDELHASFGRMGRTSYHVAVQEVISHHEKSEDPAVPALVIFQTDGAPDAKTPATQSLTEAAKSHPGVFFSFVAFGEHDNKAFDYLRKLKTENTAFFHAGPTPRELTDQEFYEGVLASWRP